MEKKAIIIGAGPAGLTAAYELLKRTDIKPIILEKSGDIGGISKTVNYKGNRIDIGGHRFFSKSDRVMNWWMNIMPIQAEGQTTFNISYQNKSREIDAASLNAIDNAGKDPDKVMLVRRRLSRIYFLRKFFTYPIQLSLDTLTKLGLWTTIAIMFSYLKAQLLPRKPEKNLEDFMINRFGQVLYRLFFKDYTEKVWGIPCDKISAEWGAQRIKGVSISKAIQHAIQSATKKKQKVAGNDIAQKDTETSLIEQFLYPKFGPGQLWEEVARQVESMGGKILMHHDVKRIYTSDGNNQVTAVAAINNITGETSYLEGDYFFSTMPVQELIGGLDGPIPEEVKEVAAGLQYRDFITVGILLKKLSFQDKKTGEWKALDLKDTWIYIQEKDVKVGRLQLFNNWSPYMVKDPDNAWVGMEFFCNKTDDFWARSDEYIKELAIRELEKIGLASQANVLDATVLRMEKTYPAYFGTYERFDVVREWVDRFENLFLVGRNGMHKYNNSDHSMLTAMVAVDNIAASVVDKETIWAVNTEKDYHEERKSFAIKKETENDIPTKVDYSFYEFVFLNKKNRIALWLVGCCILIQFTIFKILYPYANFMPDSYSYIEAANSNRAINFWPIGYSKFLRAFNWMFHSDTALVLFQYLFLQAAILYLVFTIVYFLKPLKTLVYIILCGLMLNPIFLSVCNYVSADSLFTGLSLIWFAEMIWLLYKPGKWHAIIQGGILFLAFTMRYNALYYPMVSVGVVVFCRLNWSAKLASVALGTILIGLFLWSQGNEYKRLTGEKQLSAFGGWQLASNALVMYSRMNKEEDRLPSKFKKLHQIVSNHIDSIRLLKARPDTMAGVYYLWHGPLMQFMGNTGVMKTGAPDFQRWASVAPLLGDYGEYLILKHPIKYIRYYLLPNLIAYAVPPVEFLDQYNMRRDSVGDQIRYWFRYKSKTVRSYAKKIQFFGIYPVLAALTNLAFLLSIVGYFLFNAYRQNRGFLPALTVIVGLYLLNFFFSILASPIVLRYQIFTLITIFIATILLFEQIFMAATADAAGQTKQQ